MKNRLFQKTKKFFILFLVFTTILWLGGIAWPLPTLAIDLTPPSALSEFGGPPNGQQNVPVDALVDRQFSEDLDPLTAVNYETPFSH